jgi:hypothetical protein
MELPLLRLKIKRDFRWRDLVIISVLLSNAQIANHKTPEGKVLTFDWLVIRPLKH